MFSSAPMCELMHTRRIAVYSIAYLFRLIQIIVIHSIKYMEGLCNI